MSRERWVPVKPYADDIVVRGNKAKIHGAIVGGLGLLIAIGGSSSLGGLLMLIGGAMYVYGLYLRALVR